MMPQEASLRRAPVAFAFYSIWLQSHLVTRGKAVDIMAILHHWYPLVGTWTGTSRLFMPDEPARESRSTATVYTVALGKYCEIDYTWDLDGDPQEGLLLFGSDPEHHAIVGVFLDSWHQGDEMMNLRGHATERSSIELLGSYKVKDGPDWGWRIVIEPGADEWRLVMFNRSPEGEEYPGVEAVYTRQA